MINWIPTPEKQIETELANQEGPIVSVHIRGTTQRNHIVEHNYTVGSLNEENLVEFMKAVHAAGSGVPFKVIVEEAR